jgi:class 3 adenylate cyclase
MPAFASALQHDFDLYTYMAAGQAFGWEEAEQMVRWGRDLLPQATTRETTRRIFGTVSRDDVEASLPLISSKTIILHRDHNPLMDLIGVRRVAAGIPHSRLIVLEGRPFYPFSGDGDAVLRILEEHLAPRSAAGGVGPFRTILFTDVVASTPLLAQLKDAKMRAVMRDHDAILQAAVQEHGGRVVKGLGDGFMVEFAVPSAAVESAIAMQRGIQAQFADSDVRLRIGINAGEPVEEDGDLHGASVVIAKRLESAAPENGILVSEVVKQAVAGKEFTFAAQGDLDLKGFDEPVRAWSVEWKAKV